MQLFIEFPCIWLNNLKFVEHTKSDWISLHSAG